MAVGDAFKDAAKARMSGESLTIAVSPSSSDVGGSLAAASWACGCGRLKGVDSCGGAGRRLGGLLVSPRLARKAAISLCEGLPRLRRSKPASETSILWR